MTVHVKIGSSYKRFYNAWVKVDGNWALLDSIFYKQSGWKRVHAATRVFEFTKTLTGTTYNYNLRNDLLANGWDGQVPVLAVVTVAAGAIVSSALSTNYAFNTGTTYPSGSSITVINRGTITGAGGRGGAGEPLLVTSDSPIGGGGGPAFFAGRQCTLINLGVIAGGGGGGGGGGSFTDDYYSSVEAGMGGGGGQGLTGGPAGGFGQGVIGPNGGGGYSYGSPATAGTLNSAGKGGRVWDGYSNDWQSGGNGGAFGQAGQQSTGVFNSKVNAGGAPGAAIVGIANVDLTDTGSILGVQV